MKVKETKNGNVKIIASYKEAQLLKEILGKLSKITLRDLTGRAITDGEGASTFDMFVALNNYYKGRSAVCKSLEQ
jgi:hypothetical protein